MRARDRKQPGHPHDTNSAGLRVTLSLKPRQVSCASLKEKKKIVEAEDDRWTWRICENAISGTRREKSKKPEKKSKTKKKEATTKQHEGHGQDRDV